VQDVEALLHAPRGELPAWRAGPRGRQTRLVELEDQVEEHEVDVGMATERVVGLGEIVRVRERATRAARTAPAGPTQLAARRVVVLAHERVRELDGAILVVDDQQLR